MSEQLDAMKSSLMACAMSRMSDLEHTDAEELGEVIDMIKDIEEAKYYCAITKAMEERSKGDETQEKIDSALMMERLRNQADRAYTESERAYTRPYVPYIYRGYDEPERMYYDGRDMRRGPRSYQEGGERYYDGRDQRRNYEGTEKSYTQMPSNIRDSREGKSYISRRGYMESKETHEPDAVKMDKLEKYIKELGEDITEMIRDATPAEKNTIQDKLMRLAQQIA